MTRNSARTTNLLATTSRIVLFWKGNYRTWSIYGSYLSADSVNATANQVTVKKDSLEENEPEISYGEEATDHDKDWTLFESEGIKKRENGPSVKWENEKQSARRVQVDEKLKMKLKKQVKHKKAAKADEKDLLVQQPSVPITLEEYMLEEWFKTMEEEEEEEITCSCKMVILDIDSKNQVSALLIP